MIEKFDIAGYCRISVDEEADRDNTSIENQKAIIKDFVAKKFPNSSLTFYEDRDKSVYTFEQRDGYQKMRPLLMSHKFDILIVKDFSRFARRNSRGLVELEDLRNQGVRIISIGESIITVQGILENDFYIGTLRQGKYTRRKINGFFVSHSSLKLFCTTGTASVFFACFKIENTLKRTKSPTVTSKPPATVGVLFSYFCII